ncbi:MAG: acyl-CoA dehydrogenase family protein [Syntrophomonadaceae bacterium]
MILELNEEQKMIKKMVRDYCEKEIAPYVDEWEEKGIFSRENFNKLAELGMAGIYVKPENGGSGLSVFDGALIIEEMGRVMRGMNYLAVHNMVARTIDNYGTPDQIERFVRPLAAGEKMASICITEPHAGSDVGAMRTFARREGDYYILNGSKVFITGAGQSEIYEVLCKTDKNASNPYAGMSMLIVEKGMPGFTIASPEKKLGLHSVPVCQLFFEDVKVPVENLIGTENRGFYQFADGINVGRINVAAEAVGGAQASLEAAVAYAQQREAFGKPIIEYGAIQGLIANMAINVEAARLLTYQAAYLVDKGVRAVKQCSIAKKFATDISFQAAADAIQVHGGYGYLKDYKVERYLREAKRGQIVEGTNQIQDRMIINELLREM